MLTLKSAVIGLVMNSIKLHFLTLTESLFSLNQLFISESALFARIEPTIDRIYLCHTGTR